MELPSIDGIRVLIDISLDYKTLGLTERLILAKPQVLKIHDRLSARRLYVAGLGVEKSAVMRSATCNE